MARIVLPAEPLTEGPTALRAWRDSDMPAIVVACRDPEIPRWTSVPERYGETDARAFLTARHDAIAGGAAAPFAIIPAPDPSRLLGSISLMRFDWEHRRAEVGYWLAREARGQGHVTRAVRLICSRAFPDPANAVPFGKPHAALSIRRERTRGSARQFFIGRKRSHAAFL